MKIIDDEKQTLESEDDMMTFYTTVDEKYLTEHADKITPDSFVYMFALSQEEQQFVDQIRANMAPKRVLRKKDNNEEIN